MSDATAPARGKHDSNSAQPGQCLYFIADDGEEIQYPPKGGTVELVVFIAAGGQKRTLPWALFESAASAVSLLDEGQQAALEQMDPVAAAAALSSVLPSKSGNAVDHRLGPFFESKALARKWGISTAAVHKRVVAGQLLRLVNRNRSFYPAFQFDATGRMLPGLAEVQQALVPAMSSPVSVAFWLRTPSAELGGRRPVELLWAGESEPVLRAARRLNERLSA